jgi:hypothetical protein
MLHPYIAGILAILARLLLNDLQWLSFAQRSICNYFQESLMAFSYEGPILKVDLRIAFPIVAALSLF